MAAGETGGGGLCAFLPPIAPAPALLFALLSREAPCTTLRWRRQEGGSGYWAGVERKFEKLVHAGRLAVLADTWTRSDIKLRGENLEGSGTRTGLFSILTILATQRLRA